MLVEKIGEAALFEQTAEECVELAHACLKYARHLRGDNPTHKSVTKILDNITEELADVKICMNEIYESRIAYGKVVDVIEKKMRRIETRFGEDPQEMQWPPCRCTIPAWMDDKKVEGVEERWQQALEYANK